MKKIGYSAFLAATVMVIGCATPPPPPPPATPPPPPPACTVVYIGAGNAEPITEKVCSYVADVASKRSGPVVTRKADTKHVRAAVTFNFESKVKASLDDWYVCTGELSMKAVAYKPAVGEVVLAENTVRLDSERRIGRQNALNTLVGPLQAAADKWYKENVTESKIKKACK